MADYRDSPQFKSWEKRVQRELIPMLENTSATISLVTGNTDVKFAVELGMSIMLDKPIILVVSPGVKIPDHLVRVADHIVEGSLDSKDTAARIKEAMEAVLGEEPDEDNTDSV